MGGGFKDLRIPLGFLTYLRLPEFPLTMFTWKLSSIAIAAFFGYVYASTLVVARHAESSGTVEDIMAPLVCGAERARHFNLTLLLDMCDLAQAFLLVGGAGQALASHPLLEKAVAAGG